MRWKREQLNRGAWIENAMKEHESRLISYAARLTGSWDLARDVVQDTFLKLCNVERLEVEDHLAQWLYRVCRNRALDICRKENRMKPLTKNLPDENNREASQGVELEQQSHHSKRMIDQLPKNQQEVIRLKFQSGLSYREISSVTGLTVTNVGYLIHTAIKQLRKELIKSEKFEEGGSK